MLSLTLVDGNFRYLDDNNKGEAKWRRVKMYLALRALDFKKSIRQENCKKMTFVKMNTK